MKLSPKTLLVAALSLAALLPGLLAARVGQPAPDFTLTDLDGKAQTLSAYRGKTVVLEWVNPECPIVVKHYDRSGNMPKLQKEATADGIVWLAINSGHQGAQGDFDDAEIAGWMRKISFAGSAYLRDRDGKVGRLYDARTTPHMYVIDAEGTLVFAGGIDSIPGSNPADIERATNHVRAALGDLREGRPVRTTTARPYGCSIKYAN